MKHAIGIAKGFISIILIIGMFLALLIAVDQEAARQQQSTNQWAATSPAPPCRLY